jgi:hypothetical protein
VARKQRLAEVRLDQDRLARVDRGRALRRFGGARGRCRDDAASRQAQG